MSTLPRDSGFPKILRVITWILPLTLFIIATGVEIAEEVVLEKLTWYTSVHMIFEIVIFGVAGPVAVYFATNYIRNLLSKEHLLRTEVESLNRDLEEKVAERTAELERSNAELKQLDALKSEFVSLVSHELRTPLTAINGALELMLQNGDRFPPQAKRTLEVMREESIRLTSFVQTILDVSHLEAGQLSLNIGPVAVKPLLFRSAELMLGKDRKVLWHLPDKIPPVWADEIHFEEIMRNLFSNAEKYTPPKQPIEVSVTINENQLGIEVADHGEGIPQELQAKVFERFQRGRSGENVTPGWGLGLYFAKKLTEAQGGSLDLISPRWEDTLAPGTAFIVHLPLAEDMPEEEENG